MSLQFKRVINLKGEVKTQSLGTVAFEALDKHLKKPFPGFYNNAY